MCDLNEENLERARRFEPPTPTLARLCSTTELRPLIDVMSPGGAARAALHQREAVYGVITPANQGEKCAFFRPLLQA